MSGDGAKISVHVDATPAEAFAIFTDEIDQWWRTGPAYRVGGRERGTLAFAEGRLFETFGDRTVEMGRVTAWEPPGKLSFEWRGTNFRPGEVTFVDITFEAAGEGTLVVVHHHGFAALPDGHPVRHGKTGPDFSRQIGMWWSGLASSLREHVLAAKRPVH